MAGKPFKTTEQGMSGLDFECHTQALSRQRTRKYETREHCSGPLH